MADLRFTSRKWILTKWGLILYTTVHILNVLLLLVARSLELIDASSLEVLWSSSLTVWSLGVGAIMYGYFGANVAQKKVQDDAQD
jgi:hypothetical protein